MIDLERERERERKREPVADSNSPFPAVLKLFTM